MMRALLGGGASVPQAPSIDPLDFSAKFNTPIPPEKMGDFNAWVADQARKTGRNPLNDRYDYDVNGFFLSGGGKDARSHMTDRFKKPNHPTFSNESQYHGVGGNLGGKWITAPGGSSYYEPSPLNVQMHGIQGLKQYFAQTEPDTMLLTPPQAPQVIP